jgi:hypothetical protein
MNVRRTLAATPIATAAVGAALGIAAGPAGASSPTGAGAGAAEPQTLSLRCAYYHARYHLSPHDTLDTSGADNEWWVKGAKAGCDFPLWD